MNIIHKDIYNKDEIVKPLFQFKGELRAVLRDENLNIVQDPGWICNDFTDYGDKNLHTSINYIGIGTGTGATLSTDTTLKNEVARGLANEFSTSNSGSAGNYIFYEIQTERFNPGIGTGTITEVGTYFDAAQPTLYFRQEITPIIKASYNTLDIYYKIIVTPDISVRTGTVLIDSINYDYILRPIKPQDYLTSWYGVRPGTYDASGKAHWDPLPASIEDGFANRNVCILLI